MIDKALALRLETGREIMKTRALRKRPGRKPRKRSARPRRPGCRDCRFRAPSGACLDPVLTSGRCGEYVRYVYRNKKYRRLYVEPVNPRTFKQKRSRARFGAASAKYSQSLTEEQQDTCIAAGAKLRSRSRLGQSGPLTGQQYSIHRDYAATADANTRKKRVATQVPQLQRVARKYTSQVPKPQRITQPTSGTRRGISRVAPRYGQRCRGSGSGMERRLKSRERRYRKEQVGVEMIHSQPLTRFSRQRDRVGRWLKPRRVGFGVGRFRVPGRVSVFANPSTCRPLPGYVAQRRAKLAGLRRAFPAPVLAA